MQKAESFGAEVIANPSSNKMDELISEARVHVFHTNQDTGVKLKLIYALNTSGHVIVNPTMVAGTELDAICSVARTKEEFRDLVKVKIEQELSEADFNERATYLRDHFNTKENCKKILDLI